MKRLILSLAVTGAVALTGCGSSNNDNASSSSTSLPTASTPATAPTGQSGGPVAVSMKNIQFAPKAVTVKVGQTITWTNDDDVDHNVKATSGASFSSDNFGKGGTYKYKATKAGTISYVCTLHPGMEGTILVQG